MRLTVYFGLAALVCACAERWRVGATCAGSEGLHRRAQAAQERGNDRADGPAAPKNRRGGLSDSGRVHRFARRINLLHDDWARRADRDRARRPRRVA